MKINEDTKPEPSDDDIMMDQVAREMMDAFEKKDKDQLLECFHVLVADIMSKMSQDNQE
jgi:hypothetical protein